MPWYYHLNLKDGLPFHPYFSIPLQLYLGYSNNSQWHRNLFWQQTFEVIFDITQYLSRIHIGIWRIWFCCFWIWMGSDLNQFSDFQTAPFPVPWLRLTSFVLMLSWLAGSARWTVQFRDAQCNLALGYDRSRGSLSCSVEFGWLTLLTAKANRRLAAIFKFCSFLKLKVCY